jgi:S1-C subfamily serine protease
MKSEVKAFLFVSVCLLCLHPAVSAQQTSLSKEMTQEPGNDNAAVVNEIPQKPERRIAEETILFQRLRYGVVTVEGEVGHGSGFIVDPAGIILTNQHVIRSSKEVRVRFGPDRKVQAIILHADPQKDIAALWVNLDMFPEFAVLPFAKSTEGEAPVVEGEHVLAIGSPLSQRKIFTVGIVSKVEDRAIISDINVNPGNSGGPLINSLGEVVGLVTFAEQAQAGPGISGIVRIEEAESVLRAARDAMATTGRPSAELLPVEPEIKFPLEGLARAITVEKFDRKKYTLGVDKYDITLFTPVLKWYAREEARIEAAREKEKERRKKKGAVRGTFDPLVQLRNWAEYVGEYDAVVEVLAMPEVGPTGGSVFWSSLAAVGGASIGLRYKFKAEFYEMSLLCDGTDVVPIRRGKIEHVGDLPKYLGTQAHYTFAGLYTYPYTVFDQGNCRRLEVRVFSEVDPSRPATKILEPKHIQAVWSDFKSYRERIAELAAEDVPEQ